MPIVWSMVDTNCAEVVGGVRDFSTSVRKCDSEALADESVSRHETLLDAVNVQNVFHFH